MLKIDLSDLEMTFTTDQLSGMNYYLDLESGKVLMTTEDDRSKSTINVCANVYGRGPTGCFCEHAHVIGSQAGL